MAGRFPLYADADMRGPVVKALVDHGWDVLRAIDTFPEGTKDDVHFAHAVSVGRVMVANDLDVKLVAESWYLEQRDFPGLVWWPREHYRRMTPGEFVEAWEELARQDDPFAAYPILHLKPKR